MSPGSSTESYLAFAHIGLRENPGKNLNQITCPDRESNPGHLASRPDALTVTPQVWISSTRNQLPIPVTGLGTSTRRVSLVHVTGSPDKNCNRSSSSKKKDKEVAAITKQINAGSSKRKRKPFQSIITDEKDDNNVYVSTDDEGSDDDDEDEADATCPVCHKRYSDDEKGEKLIRAKGHFAEMYEDKLKVNEKWYDLEFCLRNEDHPEFGLTRRTKEDSGHISTLQREATRRQQRVDVSYISGGKEQEWWKKIIPTSRTEQVIVADQHMVTEVNSKEFRNPHTDARGSVKMMAQQGEENSNVIMQRKRIPSLHTMAVRLAHSRRNADNNGTRNTGTTKKARGDKKRNQESGSDREESSVNNKGASVSGNLGCESESVGGNKRGIEEEINRKEDRDRNKAETNSKERSEPATAEDIAEASFYSTALKTLISVSTVILLGLIVAYHGLEVQIANLLGITTYQLLLKELSPAQTVRVSVMDFKVAALMASLRAHLLEVMRSGGCFGG
ncbi:hypothetical protein ANN_11383 [Periplaneta americana]|uniref:Uncharacterized protein n=1 Tax=Periplaneta americana TaxID=6978 RepID=A0ABQ8T6J4_PERAM|nr:hypothetical protein ANN_11383 [Periplaneta americana]